MENYFSSSDAPVLVIGAAGVDIIGHIKGELHQGSSNPAHIRTSFGGVARNVAENLARLGQEVILLSVVGEDQVGEQLIQQLETAGVNAREVLHSPDWPTGSYVAAVNARGELQFALDDMRAIQALSSAYLYEHAGLFKDASLVFLDANLSKESLHTTLTLASRAGRPVAADPTSVSLARALKPYLSQLFMVTPNSAEAAILCDRPEETRVGLAAAEAAKCLVSQGVEIAIITLAEFGLCYATSETSGTIPAIRTPIIDPTGAGDALTAAVIFALLNQIPLDDAVRLGVSAASLTLRQPGTVAPDLSLEKLYDQLVI